MKTGDYLFVLSRANLSMGIVAILDDDVGELIPDLAVGYGLAVIDAIGGEDHIG